MASERPSPETQSEKMRIQVQMGEPFVPFESNRLPEDFRTKQFVVESKFTLEQTGIGHIRIVDIATALEHAEPGINDLTSLLNA